MVFGCDRIGLFAHSGNVALFIKSKSSSVVRSMLSVIVMDVIGFLLMLSAVAATSMAVAVAVAATVT